MSGFPFLFGGDPLRWKVLTGHPAKSPGVSARPDVFSERPAGVICYQPPVSEPDWISTRIFVVEMNSMNFPISVVLLLSLVMVLLSEA